MPKAGRTAKLWFDQWSTCAVCGFEFVTTTLSIIMNKAIQASKIWRLQTCGPRMSETLKFVGPLARPPDFFAVAMVSTMRLYGHEALISACKADTLGNWGWLGRSLQGQKSVGIWNGNPLHLTDGLPYRQASCLGRCPLDPLASASDRLEAPSFRPHPQASHNSRSSPL